MVNKAARPFATRYTPEQLAQYKREFRPYARSFRPWNAAAHVGLYGGVFTAGLYMFRQVPLAGLVLAVATFVAAMVARRVNEARLKCPACGMRVLQELQGQCCPECGAPDLLARRACDRCGGWLTWGRTRHFVVRYCTHCGVKLDDDGI